MKLGDDEVLRREFQLVAYAKRAGMLKVTKYAPTLSLDVALSAIYSDVFA